ncbi:MAG: N-acetyltransferase [Prevotella sp.]|jgi:GNAT superfamily N-acetyltransferase|nr:N-acetyltransferase [Prevotella sp.]
MIHIEKVTNRKGLLKFIQFRYDLYKDDPNDVPYLFFDEVNNLDKRKNASFEQCEADYFIAYKDGKAVGRVAAIINFDANKRWDKKVVRYGWFDFIDDIEVSTALLKTVEDWGRERGMTKMTGPMGFADTDREGMLIEGFEEYGTMYASYNYPYYPKHMEQLGFQKDNDYVQCRVKVPEKVPEKFAKLAQMVEKRYNLHVHKLTRNELMKQGYGRKVFKMLNTTYNNLYGFAPLTDNKVDQLVEQYIRIADMNLISVIMDGNENDKMVGFGITFPSLTYAMRKSRNGRLLPLTWWRLLDAIKWHHADTVDMLLIGVLPEYRSKGANALIFNDLIRQYQAYGFKWAEAMPQMETNEHMLGQWQYLEADYHRRLRCFSKML